jgi:hypothetical protein
MSFSHRITILGDKSAKQAAKLINERRRQSQAWLRRQSEQKKQPDTAPIKK